MFTITVERGIDPDVLTVFTVAVEHGVDPDVPAVFTIALERGIKNLCNSTGIVNVQPQHKFLERLQAW